MEIHTRRHQSLANVSSRATNIQCQSISSPGVSFHRKSMRIALRRTNMPHSGYRSYCHLNNSDLCVAAFSASLHWGLSFSAETPIETWQRSFLKALPRRLGLSQLLSVFQGKIKACKKYRQDSITIQFNWFWLSSQITPLSGIKVEAHCLTSKARYISGASWKAISGYCYFLITA